MAFIMIILLEELALKLETLRLREEKKKFRCILLSDKEVQITNQY